MSTPLPPSIHEQVVGKHMTDTDDPVMRGLFDSVRATRAACEKASHTTAAVLRNEMRTLSQRHKQARDAGFSFLKTATVALDQAVLEAKQEIVTLKTKLKGPPPSRDRAIESRQAELRERLAGLSPERRKAIVDDAVKTDDQLLLGALLHGYAWESGLSDSEIALTRHAWAAKNHSGDVDRLSRLERAVEAAMTAGACALRHVDQLTDHDLVRRGMEMEKAANDALAAVK